MNYNGLHQLFDDYLKTCFYKLHTPLDIYILLLLIIILLLLNPSLEPFVASATRTRMASAPMTRDHAHMDAHMEQCTEHSEPGHLFLPRCVAA